MPLYFSPRNTKIQKYRKGGVILTPPAAPGAALEYNASSGGGARELQKEYDNAGNRPAEPSVAGTDIAGKGILHGEKQTEHFPVLFCERDIALSEGIQGRIHRIVDTQGGIATVYAVGVKDTHGNHLPGQDGHRRST